MPRSQVRLLFPAPTFPSVRRRAGGSTSMHRIILLLGLCSTLLLASSPAHPQTSSLNDWGLVPHAIGPEAQVVLHTNAYRTAQGLPALTVNTALNAAALARAVDMAEYGYFDHQNPITGNGPAEAIAAAGYEAWVSRENIALGTWPSGEALVQGWIDSPGHRTNILDREVREIGVALVRDRRGAGSGFARLYAVQLFGKPLSDCGELPGPDERAAIEKLEARLELLNTQLREQRRELDDLHARMGRAESRVQYNALVAARNQRVVEFNLGIAEADRVRGSLSESIDAFNAKVVEFNTCAPPS